MMTIASEITDFEIKKIRDDLYNSQDEFLRKLALELKNDSLRTLTAIVRRHSN